MGNKKEESKVEDLGELKSKVDKGLKNLLAYIGILVVVTIIGFIITNYVASLVIKAVVVVVMLAMVSFAWILLERYTKDLKEYKKRQ